MQTDISLSEIRDRLLSGGELLESEALALLHYPNKTELYDLAHEITRHFMVSIHARLSMPRAVIVPRTVNGVLRVVIMRQKLSNIA